MAKGLWGALNSLDVNGTTTTRVLKDNPAYASNLKDAVSNAVGDPAVADIIGAMYNAGYGGKFQLVSEASYIGLAGDAMGSFPFHRRGRNTYDAVGGFDSVYFDKEWSNLRDRLLIT
jgi:hypothetical protein